MNSFQPNNDVNYQIFDAQNNINEIQQDEYPILTVLAFPAAVIVMALLIRSTFFTEGKPGTDITNQNPPANPPQVQQIAAPTKIKNTSNTVNLSFQDSEIWKLQNFGRTLAKEFIEKFHVDDASKVSECLTAADTYLATEYNDAISNRKKATEEISKVYSLLYQDDEYKKTKPERIKYKDDFSNINEIVNEINLYYGDIKTKNANYISKAQESLDMLAIIEMLKEDLGKLDNKDQNTINGKKTEIADTEKKQGESKAESEKLRNQYVNAESNIEKTKKYKENFDENDRIIASLNSIKNTSDYNSRIDSTKQHWFEKKKDTFKGAKKLGSIFISITEFEKKINEHKSKKLSITEHADSCIDYTAQ